MQSVDSAIKVALDVKQVPSFKTGDLGDLASKLNLPPPVSTVALLKALKNLPNQVWTSSSGALSAGNVGASAQLGIQSDGTASFRGQVHEGGAFGDNYVLAAVFLDIKDSSGNNLAFAHSGNVAGSLDIGSQDDSFQDDGFSQLIVDNWDTAKKLHVRFSLQVSTNPFQVIETVVAGLFIGLGVLGVSLFLSDPQTKCQWGGPKGTGPLMQCTHP